MFWNVMGICTSMQIVKKLEKCNQKARLVVECLVVAHLAAEEVVLAAEDQEVEEVNLIYNKI